MLYIIAVAGALLAANTLSLMIAGWRIRSRQNKTPSVAVRPPVSIVIPLCGIEQFSRETLESALILDWPDYECQAK